MYTPRLVWSKDINDLPGIEGIRAGRRVWVVLGGGGGWDAVVAGAEGGGRGGVAVGGDTAVDAGAEGRRKVVARLEALWLGERESAADECGDGDELHVDLVEGVGLVGLNERTSG